MNDGSTDGTLALCKRYAETDARVRVIDQTNGGVSSARNAGIDAARGRYLTFVDCDDLIVTETLDDALGKLNNRDEDLLLFDFLCRRPNGNEQKSNLGLPADRGLSRAELVEKILTPVLTSVRGSVHFGGFLSKFFLASCLHKNQLRFRETLRWGEDGLFTLEFLDRCESARYLPKQFYIYRMDGFQSPNKYRTQPGREMLVTSQKRADLLEKYGLAPSQERQIKSGKKLLHAVAYSARKCSKEEFSAMLKDPLVQSAAQVLCASDQDARIKYGVEKRQVFYARLILCQNRRLLKLFAKRLTE